LLRSLPQLLDHTPIGPHTRLTDIQRVEKALLMLALITRSPLRSA
jgi:hypothetical protein